MSGLYSFINSKAEVHASPVNGKGLFAKAKIAEHEVIAAFGGKVFTLEEALKLSKEDQGHLIQIHDDLFLGLVDFKELEEDDFINHSCDPNAGVVGQIILVAMREIQPDEEITFDYATTDTQLPGFRCNCGSENCRGWIKGNDWRNPILQRKYRGYFSSYIQTKIDRMKEERF